VRFSVRFSPPPPPRPGEAEANNLKLAGAGFATVDKTTIVLADGRSGSGRADPRHSFALADVANVGYGEADEVVVLRTRADDREVVMWMQSREDALALLGLLPREVTSDFAERQQKSERFREHMRALAPKAPVTPAIIAINVAVFLALLLAGAGLMATDPSVQIRFGSNFGRLTFTGEPWRLLTSAFIHFGVVHIAFNMYALYSGGDLTERLYGSARFAVIYLVSALAGSAASSWYDPTRNSAGASGAVFGVYGALLVFFAVRRSDIPIELYKSAGRGALSLCVYSLLIGAVYPFVDNAAHIGGLLGGAAAGFLLVRPFDPAARTEPQPLRIALVAAAGVAAVAFLLAPLMSPDGERGAELRLDRDLWEFQQQEEKLAKRYGEIAAAYEAGTIQAGRAASEMRRDVQEPWGRLARELRALPNVQPADSPAARRLALYRAYAEAREHVTQRIVQELGNPGPAAAAETQKAWARVEALMAQIRELDSGKR
jgi:rhomboid protease GluP